MYTQDQITCLFHDKKLLVTYLTAGYPSLSQTLPLIKTLFESGTDLLEIGVPFSDPVADGPIIADASRQSLQQGTSLNDILQIVATARQEGITKPIILMGYYQSFFAFGLRQLLEKAYQVGLNGFLVVDLPISSDPEMAYLCRHYNKALIPLVSLSTPDSRIRDLAFGNTKVPRSPPFLYAVSRNGVTGVQTSLPTQAKPLVTRIQSVCKLPVVVGFGISDANMAKEIWSQADGVVVGSAITRLIKEVWVNHKNTVPPKHQVDWSRISDFVKALADEKPNTSITDPPPTLSLPVSPQIRGLPGTPPPSPLSLHNSGRYDQYGGQYLPESLLEAHQQLECTYQRVVESPDFQIRYRKLLRDFVGRPTPIYQTQRLSTKNSNVEIWLKREDLCFTGSHKLNNALGQALLAQMMGKTRIIAETGAGQHGVATATVCALLDLQCVVYMGAIDVERQAKNVARMKLLGAKVQAVWEGSKTLKDAINEAMRDWVTNIDTSFYVIGSAVGSHPYPTMVRRFQSIIGQEAKQQFLEATGGDVPDAIVACVGGGSNALGIFDEFLQTENSTHPKPILYGVEAEGAASTSKGTVGILHGSKSLVLQTADGQIAETQSLSAGLDYPGVSPIHAWFKQSEMVQYVTITDQEASDAFYQLTKQEGIPPALESAHAIAYALKLANLKRDQLVHEKTDARPYRILVNLSGRGDKDLERMIPKQEN